MKVDRLASGLVPALLCLCGAAAAQRTLQVVYGEARDDRLGTDVRLAGDVDADGVPDLIAGAFGYARVVSGRNGRVLHTFRDATPSSGFGVGVAGELDLDGDGRNDLLVRKVTSLHGFSGANGKEIWTWLASGSEGFTDICAIGDLDGDGRNEFAAGFRNNGEGVHVFAGDGSRIAHTLPFATPNRDIAVRAAGDVDGDRIPDLIAAALSQTAGLAGVLTVYSGRDARVIWSWPGTPNGGFRSIAGVGDVDGDGRADFAGGSPDEFEPVAGGRPGTVWVWSGRTGLALHTLHGPVGSSGGFGWGLSAAGDVDRDGFADFTVGTAIMTDPGRVQIFSGRTGAELMAMDGVPGEAFGARLDLLGDVDGDGFADLVVGAPEHSRTAVAQGSVRIVSGQILAAVALLGTGCGGGPFLPVLGSTLPRIGQHVVLAGRRVPRFAAGGALLISPKPTFPLPLGVPGCDLFVDPQRAFPLRALPNREWDLELPIPGSAALTGGEAVLQAVYAPTAGALGLDLSNGVRWRIAW